jgi:para-aminobenzoate synthetase
VRPPLRTLLIDNYDSYTYNLAHYLTVINGAPPLVVYNDDFGGDWHRLRSKLGPVDNVVISPGPGSPVNPRDFGICIEALREPDLPVLGKSPEVISLRVAIPSKGTAGCAGICLGHQGLGYLHGGRVKRASTPMHGRLSRVIHSGDGLFAGIPQNFTVSRTFWAYAWWNSGTDPPCLHDRLSGITL